MAMHPALRDRFLQEFRPVYTELFAHVALWIIAVLVVAVLYFGQGSPFRLKSTEDNTVLPLPALNEPAYSAGQVSGWMTRKLHHAFNVRETNYRRRLTLALRDGFSEQAIDQLRTALLKPGRLRALSNPGQLGISPLRAPLPDGSDVIDGRYTWRYTYLVRVRYTPQNGRPREVPATFIVTVSRSDTLSEGRFLAITDIREQQP